MLAAQLIVLMALLFVALFGLVMATFIAVMAEVPPVQLLKVFPLMVLVALPKPASVLTQPDMVVPPVKEMLENVLLLLFTVTLELFVAAVLENNVMVPPAAGLAKAVTILLPFIFCTPLVGMMMLLAMNVTEPEVLALRLVKVLLLMFCDKVAAVLFR